MKRCNTEQAGNERDDETEDMDLDGQEDEDDDMNRAAHCRSNGQKVDISPARALPLCIYP